jgi:hypothetical protein
MRPNDVSARAGFRRCSPIAWRSACSAALALVLLSACGSTVGSGGSVSPSPSARSVAFTEVAATSQARDDSGPTLIVGMTDPTRATISQLVPGATAPAGRVLVAAFQGQQNTGGYSVQITAIERNGDQLVVHATFGVPAPGAMVTQVLTSPAHVVSVAAADTTGLREAILLDQAGVEVARTSTT